MGRGYFFSKNHQLAFFLIAFLVVFSQAYSDLSITPAEDYLSAGPEGGPFSPSQKIYVVKNLNPAAITWGVSESVDWIECSPEWGTLDPNEVVDVTVSMTTAADSLTAGDYIEDVVFTDITNGIDQMRQVLLSVLTPSSGLVGWWKFDGDVTDSSGNGHDGTAHNSPGYTTGKIQDAILLNVTDPNQYVSVPHDPQLKPQLPLTLCAWVNIDQDAGVGEIVQTDNWGTEIYSGVQLQLSFVDGSHKIELSYGDGAGGGKPNYRRTKSGVTSLQPGQWYHVAGAIRGPQDMSIYINGLEENGSYSGTGGDINYSNGNLKIGARDDQNFFLKGIIDDVRIYDRALTETEVAELAGIGPLIVIPDEPFDTSGEPGGPFSPAYKDYTLKNLSDEVIYWGIDTLPDWLDADSSFGGLDPNETATVRVFLTEEADLLGEGVYNAAVTFNNLSIVQDPVVRDANLDIQVIGGIWVTPESFDLTLTEGTVYQDTLTVGNDGTETLNFSLRTRTVAQPASQTMSERISCAAAAPAPQKMTIDVQQALLQEHQPNQILVRFAPDSLNKGTSLEGQQQKLTMTVPAAEVIRQYRTVPGLSLVQIPENMSLEETLEALNARSDVLYAQPDYIMYADDLFPNDTRFNDLWGLHNTGQTGGVVDADIDAPQAWNISTGSDSVIVAVIDTGVDYTHEDLAANMWVNQAEFNGTAGVDDDGNGYVDDIYGYDFYNNDGNPMDDHYHGTHCAGTIGAVGNNGKGITGVCWDVEIMAIKFLSSGGSAPTSIAIDCVEYATLMGADVMSNSWGGGSYNQGLKDVIDAAGANGILFVAAAGNDSVNNDTYPHYPSSYNSANLIAVMATDDDDKRSSFSNWGPTSVDIGAPGSSILSCEPGNRYQYLNGTSMATPHVAGACALLRSVNPGLSVSEIKDILFNSADPISALAGKCVSEGRLNINNAILETTVPWIEFDVEQGTINPDQSVDVTVTFNNANELEPGVYYAEILILSDDPAHPVITVPVSLTVLQDPLEVSPETTFDPNGLEGGPFEPNSIVYTLSNIAQVPLEWSIDWQSEWLSVDQTAGTLDPAESIDILVSVNTNADVLLPGLHEDSLVFNNITVGSVQHRAVSLSVRPPDKFTEAFENGAGQLQNKSITFRPDDSVSYYAACVGKEPISSFATDPNVGTFITMGDDDYIEVAFAGGQQFNFYGVAYDRLYIGSNGYLTFGQGDTEFDPILEYHFALPRISALFADLTPPDDQSISYIQLDDRFVVTYLDIPVFGNKTAINSFQIELFFADGAIRLSYLNLDAFTVITGLSEGNGLPGFFEESDFSSYLPCCECGDTDGDGVIGLSDLCNVVLAWLNVDCTGPDWCQRADFDRNGQVDMLDWGMMAENWQKIECAWSEPEFLLELNGESWSEPSLLSELNDNQGYNASLPCLSSDELTMYITRYNPLLGMYSIVEATRPVPYGPFTSERVLSELNVALVEAGCTSPWVTSDNLRLYYREDISDTENRIKMAQRAVVGDPWTPVEIFDELHENGYNGAVMSLTDDELTIVWHSGNRPGTGSIDLWMATRTSIEEPFGNIRELTELNTVNGDTSPQISPDGLTIYFGSQYRDGSTDGDIFKATRSSLSAPFANIERIEFPGYDTNMWEGNPYMTPDETKLYFSNSSGGVYLTTFETDPAQYYSWNMCLSSDQLNAYFVRYIPEEGRNCLVEAARTDVNAPFSQEKIFTYLTMNNDDTESTWISEDKLRLYFHESGLIMMSERSDSDDDFVNITRTYPELQGDGITANQSLTSDELTIVYHSTESGSVTGGPVNLWLASRDSVDDPFSNKSPLDEINSSGREYNPWLSGDGLTIYFRSNRDGEYAIYKASRETLDEPFDAPVLFDHGFSGLASTPYMSPDEQSFYFYGELPDSSKKGTWKIEWAPAQEKCLPR